MRDENMLQAIDALNFCGFRINPIYFFIRFKFRKGFLVFRAEIASQVHSPVPVILPPPVEVNPKTSVQ
jgi:hypothetical protein